MSQNYLNIIGNWGTSAQRGRQRAQAESKMELEKLKIASENQLLEQQNEQNNQNRIERLFQQSQALTNLARPKDEKAMKVIEKDARNVLKSKLNEFGDDFNAFMRGGGREFINDYRDSVLNSEYANIIKANQKSLFSYLDQAEKNPMLLSAADRQGYEEWKSDKTDIFVYQGAWNEWATPSEKEIEGYVSEGYSLAEAYAYHGDGKKSNYNAFLTNMLKDKSMTFGAEGQTSPQDYRDQVITYVEDVVLGEKEYTAARVSLAEKAGGKRSYSKQLQNIFDTWDGKHQIVPGGDGSDFWLNPQNDKAVSNLEGIAWLQPYKTRHSSEANHISYSRKMFSGKELDIAKSVFGDSVGENGEISFYKLMSQQGDVRYTLYSEPESGWGVGQNTLTEISGGEYRKGDTGFWNKNDAWAVHSIELMFEVEGPDGKMHLLTKDDVRNNTEISQRNKKAVMGIVLRDDDSFLAGKDDFRYVALDLNNPSMASELNKTMGKIEMDVEQNLKYQKGNYTHDPNKKFSFTPDNVRNNLIGSLHSPIMDVFKHRNFGADPKQEYFDLTQASVLMATSMIDEENVNPYDMLDVFSGKAPTGNPESQKQVDDLMETLKGLDFKDAFVLDEVGDMGKGGLETYYKQLQEVLGFTDAEIRTIDRNAYMISATYATY